MHNPGLLVKMQALQFSTVRFLLPLDYIEVAGIRLVLFVPSVFWERLTLEPFLGKCSVVSLNESLCR